MLIYCDNGFYYAVIEGWVEARGQGQTHFEALSHCLLVAKARGLING